MEKLTASPYPLLTILTDAENRKGSSWAGDSQIEGSKETSLTFIDKFLQPEFQAEQVAIAFPVVVFEK
jgi:hypothetical protein